MKTSKIYKRNLIVSLVVCLALMVVCLVLSINPLTANASTAYECVTNDLGYTIHEVVDNAGYTPTKKNQVNKFSNGKTQLGTIAVVGDGFTIKEWNGYQAVALTGSELSFNYKQNITSSDYGGHTWKLSSDNNTVIAGYNIGEICSGGIIVLKSFNGGSTWTKATQSVKINGADFVFKPSGEDIAQGVLYKFVSVAEIYYTYQSGTYKNWHGPFYYTNDPVYDNHYTNLMQETIVYVASDNPVIGIYNDKTENHKLDLPEEISDVEAEIIQKGVSLSDNGISTTKVKLDFLKNKSHYVDYSYNGSSFKKAQDGQVLTEVGQYQIRVRSVFGTVKTYTIYIVDEKNIFESYFGEHIVSQEKRMYDSLSNIPIYCKGTTYSVNAISEFLPALYGSLSYFADEKAVNNGDAVITKWNGFHKFDGELNKNGYYAFEFTTGDVNVVNGDVVCFSFLLKVQDKGSYAPTVNKQLLTSSERNINLSRTLYSVPMYTAGGGAYVFCFNDLQTAEEFSYQAELRFVEDYYEKDGLYFYKGENGNVKVPYNSKVELYDAVRKISKQNVSYTTIDNTLQYGVMSLEEAVKNIENTSIKNDIYVVSSIQEREKLRTEDIIINNYKFIQVADYEVDRVVAKNIVSGEEFEVPFDVEIGEILPNETAKYQIIEYNWAGTNSYNVSYLTNNSAKINISYTTNDGKSSIEITSSNINTIEAKDEVVFEATSDNMDSDTIVIISKLGYIKIIALRDLSGKYLDEEGEYTIVVKNRAGYIYSFNILIDENKAEVASDVLTTGIHLKSKVINDKSEGYLDNQVNSNNHVNNSIGNNVEKIIADNDVENNLGLVIALSVILPVVVYLIIMGIIRIKRKS